ncbi:concanavalin A-like lectin/glucanase domain-containing protein [Syncephalis plumigaleata]|nr:concanavalin A-like lectin/glucanase domain-containing protein [Syncephalis plumigaleata]
MHNLLVYIGVALATMAVSVSAESDIKSVPEAEVPKRAHRKPQVIFEDDFNCNNSIPHYGKQIYDDKSAVSGYQGKYLRITAKRTNATHWTSSKILTRGKFTFTYGRVDVRVRFPLQDVRHLAKSGEIDIAEYQSAWRKNFAPDVPRTPGSLHFAKFNGGTAKSFWTKDNDPIGPGFGTQPANDTNTMHMDVDWIRVTKL